MRRHRLSRAFLLALGALLVATSAYATTALNPGDDNVTVFDTTVPGGSWVAGHSDRIIDTGVGQDFVDGMVYTDVYTNATGLLFVYEIIIEAMGQDPVTAVINRVTLIDWNGWAISSVGADSGFGGVAPYAFDRSVSGGTVGVDWTIATALADGDNSALLFFQTDAKNYTLGNAHLINGTDGNAEILVPTVPEPGMLILLGSGVVALGLRAKRRLFS